MGVSYSSSLITLTEELEDQTNLKNKLSIVEVWDYNSIDRLLDKEAAKMTKVVFKIADNENAAFEPPLTLL